MGLHEELLGLNDERVMGITRGLLEQPMPDVIDAPKVLDGYPALAVFSAHIGRLLREVKHTDAEVPLLEEGAQLALTVLARYAISATPGNEDAYPVV